MAKINSEEMNKKLHFTWDYWEIDFLLSFYSIFVNERSPLGLNGFHWWVGIISYEEWPTGAPRFSSENCNAITEDGHPHGIASWGPSEERCVLYLSFPLNFLIYYTVNPKKQKEKKINWPDWIVFHILFFFNFERETLIRMWYEKS